MRKFNLSTTEMRTSTMVSLIFKSFLHWPFVVEPFVGRTECVASHRAHFCANEKCSSFKHGEIKNFLVNFLHSNLEFVRHQKANQKGSILWIVTAQWANYTCCIQSIGTPSCNGSIWPFLLVFLLFCIRSCCKTIIRESIPTTAEVL